MDQGTENKNRPTIQELEAILNDPNCNATILPNGEVVINSVIEDLRKELVETRNENRALLIRCEAVFKQEYQKRLEAANAALREALRKLEWCGNDEGLRYCPGCSHYMYTPYTASGGYNVGHKPDCWLAALLKDGHE